ncbi:MAG: chemotaxis protein CheW [Magnetococcales bacterium]|nr:chemotaxis protein CheW [Magnetococcales bacterium]
MGVDGDVFGVDVAHVREILDHQPISRLPQAPADLLGMIDVRGQTVPVIDLRCKLGYSSADITERSRILVLEVTAAGRTFVLGLLCDGVFEVAEFDTVTLEEVPELGTIWRPEYIQAVGRRHGRFVIIFDLGRLFGDDPFFGAGELS